MARRKRVLALARALVRLILATLHIGVAWAQAPAAPPAPGSLASSVALKVSAQPVMRDAPRIGLNLGSATNWGAEQLLANIIHNPGFEPTLDRTIVRVTRSQPGVITHDDPWQVRPDGFWAGGSWHVHSGEHQGKSGTIVTSRKTAEKLPEFVLDKPLSFQGNEVVVVQTLSRPDLPAGWWAGRGTIKVSTDTRPGSPGVQSVQVLGRPGMPATLHSFIDGLGNKAGSMLPVRGAWQLRLWAKSDRDGAIVNVRFDRKNQRPFLNTAITLSNQWQQYSFDIDAQDSADGQPLELAFVAEKNLVMLDDIDLRAKEDAGQGFRKAVVDTLNMLRPGYLRDWQGQLADTTANRLAPDIARMPQRYRAGATEALPLYGLPEFLDLCARVGAQPWLVVPTMLSDTEAIEFGAYLAKAQARYKFREVIAEFGNENWNTTFRPGGFPDIPMHGYQGRRVLSGVLRGAQGRVPLITMAGGRFGDREGHIQLANAMRGVERITAAPYYLHSQDAKSDPRHLIHDLMVRRDFDWRTFGAGLPAGVKVSIYEVNLHNTMGSASTEQRNQIADDPATGGMLVRRLLYAQAVGVREQAIYTLAGYDTRADGNTAVRLWGITRGLAQAGQFRATGLAMLLMNRAIAGDAYQLDCTALATGAGSVASQATPGTASCAELSGAAYLDRGRWRMLLVNQTPAPLTVVLPSFAAGPALPNNALQNSPQAPIPTTGAAPAQLSKALAPTLARTYIGNASSGPGQEPPLPTLRDLTIQTRGNQQVIELPPRSVAMLGHAGDWP